MITRRHFSCSAWGALAFSLCFSGAQAQAVTPSPPSQANPASPVTAAQAEEATPTVQNEGIGDIVVTAQRRSESASRTPIAISVVTPDAIRDANITALPGLSKLVPALQIVQATGGLPLYFIRGVGSLAGTALIDPAVSVSYDNVALARQYQGNGQFYDLDQVEVLRGPQGTLYGRNATAGVISINPKAPELNVNDAAASITGGSVGTIIADGHVNVALGDSSALRLAAFFSRHDGYLNDGEQDENGKSVRLQFLTKRGAVKIKLDADYHHQGGYGGGYAVIDQSFFTGNPAGTAPVSASDRVGYYSPRGQAFYAARGRNRPTVPQNQHQDNEYYGFDGLVEADLGFATLTAIPAYRHARLDYYNVLSFAFANQETDDQHSLELRLTSQSSGRFRWILGGFGLKDEVRSATVTDNFNGTGTRPTFRQTTKSWAAFGDGTFDIVPGLRALGGIRYTEDHKRATGLQTNLPGTGGFIPLDGDRTFAATNYRAGLQYDVAATTMAYLTFATGYHAGGFFFANIVNPGDTNTYDPERIKALTFGVKTKLFDNRLKLDVELFRWKLRNQQATLTTIDVFNNLYFKTLNVGSSRNQGVEVDAQFRPKRNTLIGAKISFLDAKFQTFGYTQAIAVQPQFTCLASGAAPIVKIDCSGKRPPQAPKWSINLNADQTFDLSGGNNLVVGIAAHYQSETLVGFNYLQDDYQKGVWTEDAQLTFHPAGDRWSVGAFVTNLTDRTIKMNASHNGNVQAYQLRPPRVVGGRASIKF